MRLGRASGIVGILATTACCPLLGIGCPPQQSYYDALQKYAQSLGKNVIRKSDLKVVPVTNFTDIKVGGILIDDYEVQECSVDPTLVQLNRPMATQPAQFWNTSFGVSGSVPASMLGGLANLNLALSQNSNASLSFGQPTTMDQVYYDDFGVKVVANPECLRRIRGRQAALVQGIIRAPESWSWSAGTVVKGQATINVPGTGAIGSAAAAANATAGNTSISVASNPARTNAPLAAPALTASAAGSASGSSSTASAAGPSNGCEQTLSTGVSFSVCYDSQGAPVSISEATPSPRFYVVLPIAAQTPTVAAVPRSQRALGQGQSMTERSGQLGQAQLMVGGQVSGVTIDALSRGQIIPHP